MKCNFILLDVQKSINKQISENFVWTLQIFVTHLIYIEARWRHKDNE